MNRTLPVERTALLEAVLAASPHGFALYELSGPCVWANPAVAELIGARPEQVLEQDYRRIGSWKQSGLLEAAEHALASDSTVRRQLSVVTTFGKQAQLEIEFGRVDIDGRGFLLLSICEITDLMAANLERQAALAALERSQQEFRAIVDQHPEAILVSDEAGILRFANPRAAVMLGSAVHRLVGKPLQLTTVTPSSHDVEIVRADGTRGVASVRSAPTAWKGTQARLITLHDITDLRRAEDDLRASEQLIAQERQREEVDRLAGSVAHSLNNQLMVLRGHLELLEAQLEGHAVAERRFPVLFEALDQLRDLGRGVMDMGRPQPAPTDGGGSPEPSSGAAWVVEPPTAPVILLAEDEPELRATVAEALMARGFEVLEAADGPAALELARGWEGTIDLLLTDVVMPGMDGVELHLLLTQERPDVPVLYMSGYAESDYAQLHDLAAQGRYLQKPFSIHYLAGKVEQALADA